MFKLVIMEGVPKSSLEMAPGRLPARLFFFDAPENYQPPSTPNTLFLCTDQTLVYTSFFADFGPGTESIIVRLLGICFVWHRAKRFGNQRSSIHW